MGQENGKERANVKEITGGNVVDILTEFNERNEQRPQDVVEDESQSTVTENTVEGSEGTEVVEKKEELTDAEKQWIIDGKFEDTEDGRKALGKSYRELQSEFDKRSQEYGDKDKHYEALSELEQWLIDNPNAVKMIKDEYIDANDKPSAPDKPADFEPLDIGVDGTPSNDWFLAVQEYNRKLGSAEAKGEVQKLRDELRSDKEATERDAERRKSLIEAGLDESEVESYKSFMNNPDMSNDENLVKIYRLLSGNKKQTETEGIVKELNSPKERIVKTPAAAAVAGTTPILTSKEEEKKKFLEGIMSQGR